MKKYILKLLKDDGYVCGEFFTKQQAAEEMNIFIADYNKIVSSDKQITPFDFKLEEVDLDGINEAVNEYKKARLFLGNLNPRHLKALSALNKLFIIAEAWNKADDFVPDFSNTNQYKYYPWFFYDKDAARFVVALTLNTASHTYVNFGSRLCFKTANRAHQFGKMFTDLFNEIFLL